MGHEPPPAHLTGGDPAVPAPGSPIHAATASLLAVLRNRDIRSLELAWTLGVGADWALLVVALLVAYEAGGPVLVGLVGVTRMVPATIVNLLVDTGSLARPERALVFASLVRGAGAAVVAGAVVAGLTPLAFVAVAVSAAAGALVRPTKLALLPAVAVTPAELVSANVAGALGESLGTFAGPLVAGFVVARSGPAPAAALAAATCLFAAIAVARVHVQDAARPPRHERPRGVPVVSGIRELVRRPAAGWVMASFLAQTIVRGALTTYLAILAIEVLGLGDPGVGLLGAAIGLGGIAGAVVALALGSRQGLAPMHAAALVAWGAPIAVIGLVPVPAVALVALGIVGIGNALLDVAGITLLQRGTPNRARTAVFAVLEISASGGVSVGGILGSLLIAGLGIREALVLTGLVLPLVAVAAWRWIRRLDREGVIPDRQAALLRAIPLFSPLPLAALERVATGMREVRFADGEPLMTQGETGETYLVIADGQVEVTIDGRPHRRQGPGDGIGEIALLRAVPRTATVTALGPVEAFEIDCDTFLDAVSGHEGSAAAGHAVVEARLRGAGS
jgi:MFS family permease